MKCIRDRRESVLVCREIGLEIGRVEVTDHGRVLFTNVGDRGVALPLMTGLE